MGINAIVITENAHGLSAEAFAERLDAHPWGRRAAHRRDGSSLWKPFNWEGRPYFTWLSAPRWRYLGLGWADDEQAEAAQDDGARPEPLGPDPNNSVQITFLKIMLAVERITGGPIYLGLDAVGFRMPEDATGPRDEFWLPPRLDDWLEDWRSVDHLQPKEPGLVY
jgi:hypothetical protein